MAKKNNEELLNDEIDMIISLRKELDESFSKSKNYSVRNSAEADIQYPTGFFNLDFKNGQIINVDSPTVKFSYESIGIVDGSINMFIGRSGCGKSTIVKQIAANIVKPFPNGLIFEDSIESGITAKRNEILTGFTPDEMAVRIKSRNAGVTIESVYEQIKVIHDIKIDNPDKYRYNTCRLDSRGIPIYKFQPTVYIIDSLAMLSPAKYTQEEELSGQMSTTATAKQLALLFRKITPIIKEANIILLVVNHITQKVEINPFAHTKSQNQYLKPDETLPGGVTPLYVSNNVFRLDDGTKLTSDKEFGIDGCYVTVSMVKSRTSSSGASSAVDLIFDYNTGFDPDLSLFCMLKNAGRINGAGAYLYIGQRNDYKFSQKQFKQKLVEEPELLAIFRDECLDYLRTELRENERRIKENKPVSTLSILDALNASIEADMNKAKQ